MFSHIRMETRAYLLSFGRTALSLLLVGIFSVFAFGQAVQSGADIRELTPFELIGWIALTGAGITHIATNVYNLIRGKNYEQIKEALANYKELADSRRAKIVELEAHVAKLQLEAENAVELAMRVGAIERGKR